MSICTMLVGVSGSGKDFLSEKLSRSGARIFSSDKIREEFYGDESIQKDHSKIFNELHKRIIKSLQNGEDCIYNATNLSSKRRAAFIRMIRNSNIACTFKCIVVATPPSICIERDRRRERTVGADVIWRQIRQFEIPSYSEGWDKIDIMFNGFSPLDLMDLDAIKRVFRETPLNEHNNAHHSLPIYEHMERARYNAIEKTNDIRCLIAAEYHDIGKYYTKTNFDMRGRETSESHFYGHQNVGAYLFICSNYIYKLSKKDVLDIAFLIQYHMEHYTRDEKSLNSFYDRNPKELINLLHLLEDIDKNSH